MLEVIKAVFKVRWKYTIRYPGWLIMFFIFPIIFSVIPIVLGWAVAGSPQQAAIIVFRKINAKNFCLPSQYNRLFKPSHSIYTVTRRHVGAIKIQNRR